MENIKGSIKGKELHLVINLEAEGRSAKDKPNGKASNKLIIANTGGFKKLSEEMDFTMNLVLMRPKVKSDATAPKPETVLGK